MSSIKSLPLQEGLKKKGPEFERKVTFQIFYLASKGGREWGGKRDKPRFETFPSFSVETVPSSAVSNFTSNSNLISAGESGLAGQGALHLLYICIIQVRHHGGHQPDINCSLEIKISN